MSVSFVHLSDIHFGQEAGGTTNVHNDVKERLIEDVRCVTGTLQNRRATGIIVTGDIAFGGRDSEYREAGKWLDRVADAAGCATHNIQVVPGNHDIDRSQITEVTRLVLDAIAAGGDRTLDRVLASEEDRDLLFRRFAAYRPFAHGYRCPLNTDAELEEHVAKLAPGRYIRFVRVNSALICSAENDKGNLLLGARQRVLRPRDGEEIVVLCHHPVHWLQDSRDAIRFLRSRARVFMSGHEHIPSLTIDRIEEGRDLMMLAAGAAVPSEANERFSYRYNIIEFDWNVAQDALSIGIWPRVWIDEEKRFGVDEKLLAEHGSRFVLGSPYFRNAKGVTTVRKDDAGAGGAADTVVIATVEQNERAGDDQVSEEYPLLLLRFFRDISATQRMSVLISLGAIPKDWGDPLNEFTERKSFDSLVRQGRIDDLKGEIAKRLNDG